MKRHTHTGIGGFQAVHFMMTCTGLGRTCAFNAVETTEPIFYKYFVWPYLLVPSAKLLRCRITCCLDVHKLFIFFLLVWSSHLDFHWFCVAEFSQRRSGARGNGGESLLHGIG